MPRFNYVALDARGQEATGLVEAASTNAAITQLRQSGYFPTSVIEEAISGPDGQEARRRAAKVARTTKPRVKKGIVLFERRKVRSKVLMIFTRQLATLIDSGLPLLRSLNVLARQERDKLMKKTIIKVADSVQSGSTFSDALALHPRVFNDLYVNMVKAGEVGGVLELVLTRLSEFQEKAAKIKNKVAAAMVYPGIVMTMALGIMTFLLIFIVPRFEMIFQDLLGDKPLPPVTRFVMGVSGFVKSDGLIILDRKSTRLNSSHTVQLLPYTTLFRSKIKNKVAAAMVYPGIVMTMALGIMTFLLIFIVPRFEMIFQDLLGDKPLPPVTRFVMGVSGFVKSDGLII